jgi:hypothetical protein
MLPYRGARYFGTVGGYVSGPDPVEHGERRRDSNLLPTRSPGLRLDHRLTRALSGWVQCYQAFVHLWESIVSHWRKIHRSDFGEVAGAFLAH